MSFSYKSEWRSLLDHKITTNSRWLSSSSPTPSSGTFYIPQRDYLPKNSNTFHGVWIPEIPYQMLIRFTEENDRVWSVFGGSGVDAKVCEQLNRHCYITDLTPLESYIEQADAAEYKCKEKVRLALVHPPYYNIVKFSHHNQDGSNCASLTAYIDWFKGVALNIKDNLQENGHVILCCGNIYLNSEEIELGEILKLIFLRNGFTLKQHIIKDYGETKKGNAQNYNLNYYRQIRGGYGNFYGDNILVLKYQKSKNMSSALYDRTV